MKEKTAQTNVVVNIAANYKLPKPPPPSPPPPEDGGDPPPAPPAPPLTPQQTQAALARSRVPASTTLSVAGVTRHAKNAPADWKGVGDSDFAPAKRGRVELGGSTTGSASFAIEFEGDGMGAAPIIMAQTRFPSNEGFHHPEMMDSFGAELTGAVFPPSFSAIFNRKMQKLPLFSCILIRNEGKPLRRNSLGDLG